jgi:hypothetical protein
MACLPFVAVAWPVMVTFGVVGIGPGRRRWRSVRATARRCGGSDDRDGALA